MTYEGAWNPISFAFCNNIQICAEIMRKLLLVNEVVSVTKLRWIDLYFILLRILLQILSLHLTPIVLEGVIVPAFPW